MGIAELLDNGFVRAGYIPLVHEYERGYAGQVTVRDPFDCPLTFNVEIDVSWDSTASERVAHRRSPDRSAILDVVWNVQDVDEEVLHLVAAPLLELHANPSARLAVERTGAGSARIVCVSRTAVRADDEHLIANVLRDQGDLAIRAFLTCEHAESRLQG